MLPCLVFKAARFVDSYGESASSLALSEAGKTLLIVREDQGATACASPEESNERKDAFTSSHHSYLRTTSPPMKSRVIVYLIQFRTASSISEVDQ